MTVVKANFVKRGRGERNRAKATLRYMQHRPGRDNQKLTRALFGPDGRMVGPDGRMDRKHSYRLIDTAGKGTIFFRIILSPDPKLENTGYDLDLRTMTIKTMQILEKQLKQQVSWIAVEHSDHTPNRHIHALVLLRGRLSKADMQALRLAATREARFQRHERDLALGYQKPQRGRPAPPPIRDKQGHKRVLQAKPLRTVQTCYSCGEEQPVSIEERRCSTCGVKLRPFGRGYGGAGWG